MSSLPLTDLHRAQIAILEKLRHQPRARFSELRTASGLDSDIFKFHLRKLVTLQVVTKTVEGDYALTVQGKEYSNSLNQQTRSKHRQPKQSLILVVTCNNQNKHYVLMQQRKRQPFWNIWGLLSCPLVWGELPEEAARLELFKQTNLDGNFELVGFCRQRSVIGSELDIHEDNFFTVLKADVPHVTLQNSWYAGHSKWVELPEVDTLGTLFPTTHPVLDMIARDEHYRELDVRYPAEDY